MAKKSNFDPVPLIAEELDLPLANVVAVAGLLDDGGTVPFIARYRKEATGGLDEVQIRAIQDRREYLGELEQRRETILTSISEQGKMTEELRRLLMACQTKSALEDLYLPFKPKRRTRATIARERGLDPLAQLILGQPPEGDPQCAAEAFVDLEKGVEDVASALTGARAIVAEAVAERAEIRGMVRGKVAKEGMIVAQMHPGQKGLRTKFEQYYDFQELISGIPSHRFLALKRGEREKVLRVGLEISAEQILRRIELMMELKSASPFAGELKLAIDDAYQRLLLSAVETDIRADLKLRSDEAAIDVFASNLSNLLLASPLGARSVIGIDPGIRTGCKCVAVDQTGKFLDFFTLFIHRGEEGVGRARGELLKMIQKHTPFAVAIGNGTGGRETESFVRETLAAQGIKDVVMVQVNESGASIYSASDIAREEFPELDLTVRGAISIARRLQDPLAELVKIDPKAIGVGQYQHDVSQPHLQKKLDEVVESCVNQVGVEVNTASAPLLARVAGIGPKLAKKIVSHREERGAFISRKKLLDVSGLGARTFEQAAGFLRVREGEHPLDRSAVHPERYKLVNRMARDIKVNLAELVGSADQAARIDITHYIGEEVGEPTLRDIIEELRKPGRDPRTRFEPPKFNEEVMTMEDLTQGMSLEGVVTNVTAFGAFVDVGVHQDGLVHISQLADRFVKDPREVVQVGDTLKVRVLEVDLERKRISLTARSGERTPQPGRGNEPTTAERRGARHSPGGGGRKERDKGVRPEQGKGKAQGNRSTFSNNPFSDLLKKKI